MDLASLTQSHSSLEARRRLQITVCMLACTCCGNPTAMQQLQAARSMDMLPGWLPQLPFMYAFMGRTDKLAAA